MTQNWEDSCMTYIVKMHGDMYSSILADRVYELKETQKGVEFMCHEMEQIYSEGIENGIEGIKKGIEKGIEQGKRETVLSLAEMGLSVEKIAKAVKTQCAGNSEMDR